MSDICTNICGQHSRILVNILRASRNSARLQQIRSAQNRSTVPSKTESYQPDRHRTRNEMNQRQSKGTRANATCKRNKRGRAQRRQLDPTLIKRSDTARARKTDQQTDTARAGKPTATRRARGPMQPASATKRACTAETSGRTSRVPLANNSNENTQTTVTV